MLSEKEKELVAECPMNTKNDGILKEEQERNHAQKKPPRLANLQVLALNFKEFHIICTQQKRISDEPTNKLPSQVSVLPSRSERNKRPALTGQRQRTENRDINTRCFCFGANKCTRSAG